MKKIYFIFAVLFLFLSFSSASAGNKTKYWIFFKDKGELFFEKQSFGKTGNLYIAAEKSLSQRSLERRKRTGVEIDYLDVPVNDNYITKLKALGVVIENTSKWFNAVTAYLEDPDIQNLKSLSFISELRPVALFKHEEDPGKITDPLLKNMTLNKVASKYSYGYAQYQVNSINVPKVHDLGITGEDVIVGMLDSGFDWRHPSALNKLKVLKEYDFVFKDSITANQAQDVSGQDSHGTLCFSILAGYAPDTLIGPSFSSQFILGKTENIASETRIEEDNWAAGIEWMENLGVDVVSSSLGYNTFDNDIGDYTYQDMNGATAICTIAADIAVSKGIVVVVAAGNEGTNSWKYMTAPADGKNVIAVGALSTNGVKASFSSFGPTSDGRIKPDVSALGVSVFHVVSGTTSMIDYSSGTSVACPLVAGVASLIVSARPDLTPAQVRDALRNTASIAANPNNEIGWGNIDAYKALVYNGIVYSNKPQQDNLTDGIKISTYIASKYIIDMSSVKVYYSTDNKNYNKLAMAQVSALDATNSGLYSVTLPVKPGSASLYYYFSATDEKGERRHPYNAPVKSFSILDTEKNPTLPNSFSLYQNYPNPFNPSTEIKFDIKQKTGVKLTVFNSLGQSVKVLIDHVMNPETYTVNWNGLDQSGKKCSSGLYYYRLETGSYSETKKMMLLK
jgi:serine protease AprX